MSRCVKYKIQKTKFKITFHSTHNLVEHAIYKLVLISIPRFKDSLSWIQAGLGNHTKRLLESLYIILPLIYKYSLQTMKAFTIIFAVALALANSEVISANQITPFEMNGILDTIDTYFFASSPTFSQQIRKFLRGAFHDCMGGCDGSINTTNPSNKGLESLAKTISSAYTLATNTKNTSNAASFKKLTRADFWALSVQRALAWGIKNGAKTPSFTGEPIFYYGRVSQPTGAFTDPFEGTFPEGEQNWANMLNNVFSGVPILTQYDIVALLGLHGTGSAGLKNSGFSGPWGPISDLNIVNNNFYIYLLSTGYPKDTFYQVKASDSGFSSNTDNITSEKIEWAHDTGPSPAKMMMPIDMMIYLSFHVNSTGGTSEGEYCPQGQNQTLFNCSSSNSAQKTYLPLASTAEQAFAYAKDQSLYINELIPIYLKMVNYVNPQVTLIAFQPEVGCVNGIPTCLGDVFFTGCGTVTTVC